MELKDYSIDDLKAEIVRRQKPVIDTEKVRDLSALFSACNEFIEYMWSDGASSDGHDFEHYVFSAAIKIVFGDDIWDRLMAREKELGW
jgi:hypothetical protein